MFSNSSALSGATSVSPAHSTARDKRRTGVAAWAALLTASALVLAGCATSPAPGTPSASGETEAPAPSVTTQTPGQPADGNRTEYPLTIDNCGTEVTFTQPPKAVVTAKSSTTEAMLALGLGERIVATTFSDGPLPTWLEEAGAQVPAVTNPLSDQLPSMESTLELAPDLVFAGWESNLSADGIGPRESFTQLGVNTYVAPSACKEPGYQPDPLTYDHVFDDITQLGQIFDAQDRAAALIASQRGELETVAPDNRGLTALWWSSGSKTPFVGGGIGSAQLAMDSVGLTNIAAGIEDSWGSMSWEKVIESDPDVIVLVDSAWGSTEKKIGVLKDNPVTAQLSAVVNERYLVVPFPATEAGVRSVSAATELARELAELDLDSLGQAAAPKQSN
ncbi:putative F420-0 ABC transporter substrate-binding protein [Jonesiaceae bacterium BS-20]|uniref:F420-0 ABC transporter substrate-binding protein n=1 Tax=Jonesiaceae bacterium BS-20 TaxID=3120821 RepID=A0AAU7DXK5_9MICO